MPTTKSNMTKVEKAKKVLQDAGYNLDLLFSTFDAEEAIRKAAEEQGAKGIDEKAFASEVLEAVTWSYYSQQVNDDIQNAAENVVEEYRFGQKNTELLDTREVNREKTI
jgi:hypothetical protein